MLIATYYLSQLPRIRRRSRRVESFAGTLEATSEIPEARIFDTTRRDGELTPQTSFSARDKRELAAVLDEMGTHIIEVGFQWQRAGCSMCLAMDEAVQALQGGVVDNLDGQISVDVVGEVSCVDTVLSGKIDYARLEAYAEGI